MRTDRRGFLLQTGAVAFGGGSAAEATDHAKAAEVGHPAPAAVQALIDAERARILDDMQREGIEGVSVCLIHDGAPVWVEGFGATDAAHGRAVDRDTLFSIQSTSKNITATAVLLAVQRGLVDLDTPITDYLPGFTAQSRFEADPARKITLRLLLSHRAGFTHEAPVGNNYDPAFPDFDAHVRSISETWLRYPVGERYRYSNLGFDLAGAVVAARASVPFPEWVRKVLFAPLGMDRSTLAPETYMAEPNRAVGHAKGYATVPLRTPLIPSGGVYISARDMAAYARFHLSRGATILDEKLWREMHGFGLGGDYGFGVIREERRYGDTPVRLLSHQGGGFGFGSVFYYCPEADLAYAAFFNRSADTAYLFGRELVDRLLERRYGKRRPRVDAAELATIAPPATRLKALAGTYVARNGVATLMLEDGGLRLRQDKIVSPFRFTSPEEGFVTDEHQEVVSYRLYDQEGTLPAHLESSIAETSLDLNDRPDDPPSAALSRWNAHLGNYDVLQWGQPGLKVAVTLRKGYLELNGTRLVVETEPGLFFTCDGEAVDFRQAVPTWKNLRLLRTS